MAKVSVIIVNYNGHHFLGELFKSLARQTLPADEVILVDNASADGSVEFVRASFPWVKVIAWPTNVGFAEGCNIGVANAQGEYIGLLNPDCVADERWLAELVQALEGNENIAGADSKIYRADENTVIEEAGAGFNNLGYLWPFGFNQPDTGQFSAITEVPAFTACAGLLRRQAFEGEQLFDRRLFMYNEEFDLTLRLRSRGYSIVFAPTSVVYHKGSRSVAQASQKPLLFKRFYHDRNRIKILAKYYPVSVLLRSLPLIFLSFAYGDWQFLRYGGPLYLIRAKAAQVQYAFQGLIERLRGPNIKAEKWLLWMEYHGLRDMLALKASRGE
ncbi:MAG: glycosyltransferase family 2 protein [Acidobacteriota bacterium]